MHAFKRIVIHASQASRAVLAAPFPAHHRLCRLPRNIKRNSLEGTGVGDDGAPPGAVNNAVADDALEDTGLGLANAPTT